MCNLVWLIGMIPTTNPCHWRVGWRAALILKNYMAKWHHFKLFADPHITKCSYVH